jgi:carboxyl-terminal processing protease
VKRVLAAALLALVAAPGLSSLAFAAAEVYKAAETFDAVWTIVRNSHFDPAFDLAAWDRVNKELRPRALAATTQGELRGVLREMLGRLGLSHFAVIPASPDTPSDRGDLGAEPGFDTRLVDRQLVVSSVETDGGAAAAGVRDGWIVQAIDGTPASAFLEPVTDSMPPRIAQVEAWRLAVTHLRGPYDSKVNVTFADASGAAITKSIARRGERGEPVTVGSLPTMFVRVTSSLQTTPGGGKAGVIGFNVWMAAVDREFQRAIDRYRTADGIVIDLRGNPGGLAAMVMGIAGHFTPNRDTLGVMKTKDSELRFNANPRLVNADGQRVEPYAGPLAILVDSMTGSASECFAGGMQSLGRAKVFGQTSMGQALPALFDKLPNGDVLIHAWGDFVTGTGVRIEGRGVVPDVPVALTRDSLLSGRDATLDAALAWIDTARRPQKNTVEHGRP